MKKLLVLSGMIFLMSAQAVFAQGGDTGVQDVGNPGNSGFTCVKPLVCPTPAAIRYDANIEAIDGVRDSINSTRGFFSNTISITLAMSNTMATVIIADDVITASAVPDDYAPTLPRPVAQIGWQFESMGSDLQRRYSVSEWGKLFIQVLVVPIKFIKGLIVLGRYLGPLGLFLAWLLVVFPIVAWKEFIKIAWMVIVKVYNLVMDAWGIIRDLWNALPL
jgi:hypothetical protein